MSPRHADREGDCELVRAGATPKAAKLGGGHALVMLALVISPAEPLRRAPIHPFVPRASELVAAVFPPRRLERSEFFKRLAGPEGDGRKRRVGDRDRQAGFGLEECVESAE
jgi:hypothetical protein